MFYPFSSALDCCYPTLLINLYFNTFPPDLKAVRVGAFFPSPGGRHQGEGTEGLA